MEDATPSFSKQKMAHQCSVSVAVGLVDHQQLHLLPGAVSAFRKQECETATAAAVDGVLLQSAGDSTRSRAKGSEK